MSPKGNPADRNHYKIDSDETGFLQAKAEMRAKLKVELADLNLKLKSKNKRIKSEKILDLFENSAGESQKERIVKRRNGAMILKDKSGSHREKVKLGKSLSGRDILKIKDRNNKEVLKVDLEKDEVKRDIGGWLEDLKEEVHEDDEVVKEVPKVRNGVLDLKKGESGTYDLANDVIGGKAEEYSIKFPNLNGGHIAYSTENPSKLDFKNDLPKGTYVIEWRAKNKEGWSETATLTLNVTEKQEVVDEKAREEYNKALENFREKEQAVQDPTLGDPNTGVKYNLEQVEGQVADAEEAYQAALVAAENFAGISPKERKDLDDLKKHLDTKKAELEKLQKIKEKKLEEIDSEIEKKVQEEIDKQKKAQDEQKKVVDQIKQKAENLENQLKSQKVAKESFEKIRNGQFSIEKETGFKEGNLDTLEGIEVEMQKHEQAVRLFRAEMATMNAGVAGLQEDFAKFEEEKANSIGAAIGGTGTAVALGIAAATGPAGWAALAIGGGVMAGFELTKSAWGTVKGWFSSKSKKEPTFTENGSFLGMLGNGNKEAYEAQSKKIKFEQNFAGLSQDLKAKEDALHTQAEQIYSAADDPERVLANKANKIIGESESNIEKSINDLYFVVGETAPVSVISDAKDKIKEAIMAGDAKTVQDLKTKSAAGKNSEADILQKTSTKVLDQNKNYISSVNYKAADIGDYTFGALGKFLKKGKDIPVLGGIANGLGKMSEGIGTIISRPGQVLKGIGRLVGIGDSKVDGMNFLERAGDAWVNLGKGILAWESYQEADSIGDYVNAVTETITNTVVAFYTMGGSAGANTGFVARNLGRIGKNGGRINRFATRVGRGADKFGRAIRNPRTTGGEILRTAKKPFEWVKGKIRGKNGKLKTIEDADIQLTKGKEAVVEGRVYRPGDEISFVDNAGNITKYKLAKINDKSFWLEDGNQAHLFKVENGKLLRTANKTPNPNVVTKNVGNSAKNSGKNIGKLKNTTGKVIGNLNSTWYGKLAKGAVKTPFKIVGGAADLVTWPIRQPIKWVLKYPQKWIFGKELGFTKGLLGAPSKWFKADSWRTTATGKSLFRSWREGNYLKRQDRIAEIDQKLSSGNIKPKSVEETALRVERAKLYKKNKSRAKYNPQRTQNPPKNNPTQTTTQPKVKKSPAKRIDKAKMRKEIKDFKDDLQFKQDQLKDLQVKLSKRQAKGKGTADVLKDIRKTEAEIKNLEKNINVREYLIKRANR